MNKNGMQNQNDFSL